jgi:exosome complex exonuclease DIS3/RRP44
MRFLVSIDSWPANSKYPLGHYVSTLGEAGDKEVETKVLLHEYKIPFEAFSAKVMACLPDEDYEINMDDAVGRRDLRHLPVVSIDPPGCKDIDDALHCIELPDGNLEIGAYPVCFGVVLGDPSISDRVLLRKHTVTGVHIADVTHFVKAGSPLDEEAANRSTSTYLVGRRLDMLPVRAWMHACLFAAPSVLLTFFLRLLTGSAHGEAVLAEGEY